MPDHPEIQPAAERAVLLPIEWQARGRAKETRLAVETWLEALLSYSGPVSLSFRLTAGAGTAPSAGIIVRGLDLDASMEAAQLIKASAEALNAWQGFGEPIAYDPPSAGANVFDLRIADGPGREIFNTRSAPWVVAQQQDRPTTMVIDLLGNDHETVGLCVRCSVSLHGEGPASEMIATLLAADPPGPVRLEPVPRTDEAANPPELSLPLEMVAHLASSPARMPEAWPTQPVRPAAELLDLVDSCMPPHAVFFGGSGLGKTTVLEHLIAQSLDDGNTVVVICPHGDLAARAASIAAERRVDFSAIDFADERHQARWNLCIPPSGVEPRQWATELVPLIRNAWGDSPNDWFGPVWVKSVRLGLSVLTRDPLGPHPLTKLVTVMQPPLTRPLRSVLDRIADPVLTRDLEQLHSAIEKDPHGSWGIWVTSKLEPFTADDRMRAVLGHRDSTVDLSGVVAGRSLVVSAPAAALGDEGATLLASTLLTQLWHLARQRRDRSAAIDLFVDEVHRIPAATLTELLTEGRKFGVRLRVATQSPQQLTRAMKDAVLTNSGAVGTFRTGPRDAELLDGVFPTVPAGVLTRLDRHWLAITDSERELVGPTAGPIVDCDDRTALEQAHADSHGPTRSDVLAQLRGVIDALIDLRADSARSQVLLDDAPDGAHEWLDRLLDSRAS